MSNHSAINPKGTAELYVPTLRPLSQLDLGKCSGAATSAREIARNEAAKQGYDDGFVKGLAAGEASFLASHRTALEAFVEDLDVRATRLDVAYQEWCQHLEGPLAELAVVIASRIVGQELKADPETVLSIARQAVAEVTHATQARIRLNPFDSELVRTHKDSLLAASGGLRTIEIVDDPSIIGGCVVDTDGGSIDARIESMIEQARHGLRGDR